MKMIRSWHRSSQELKFQLSDLTFGKVVLNVLACEIGPVVSANEVRIPPELPLERDMVGYVMRGVPTDGDVPRFAKRDGFIIYCSGVTQRYFVDLRQSFDDYIQGFKSKTRSTLKRKVKKFMKSSGADVEFRVFREPGEMEEFHGAARSVSEETYQERLLDAGLPSNSRYVQELVSKAHEDRVRGYLLYHGGKPVSYLLLSATEDILAYEFLGYNPEFSKWSIGTVLHWLALERIFEEKRFSLLDFTEGEGEQKRLFGTNSVTCANIYCLKKGGGRELLVRTHAGVNSLSSLLGITLRKLNLQSKIKKFIRSS